MRNILLFIMIAVMISGAVGWPTAASACSCEQPPGVAEELDHAETYGTHAVDWSGPDYQLVFKHEDKTIYEIGYNTELLRLGVGGEGRYSKHQKLFEVATELPIE